MNYHVYDVTVSGMEGDEELTAVTTMSLDTGTEQEAQREIDSDPELYRSELDLDGPLEVIEVEFNQEATDEAQAAEYADLRNDMARDEY